MRCSMPCCQGRINGAGLAATRQSKPVPMATSGINKHCAAKCAVAQVYETVELGELDPEVIVTPGIYVGRVVKIARDAAQKEAA